MMAQHPSPPYPNTYLPTNFYQPHSFTSYPYPPQSFHPPLPYPVPGPAWPTFSAFPVATTQPFSESCSTPSAPPHPIEETCERSLESQGLDLPSAVCSTEELDSCPTVTNEIVNVSSGIEAVALSTPDNAEYCLPSSSYPIIENISINNQCPSSSSNVSDDVAVPVQFQPQLVNSANHSTDAHASQSTLKMNSESIENDVRVVSKSVSLLASFRNNVKCIYRRGERNLIHARIVVISIQYFYV